MYVLMKKFLKIVYYCVQVYLLMCIILLFTSEFSDMTLENKVIAVLYLIIIMYIIYLIYKKMLNNNNSGVNQNDSTPTPSNNDSLMSTEKVDIVNDIEEKMHLYEVKPLLTTSELAFYTKIEELNNNYVIVPQVNLASIINKIHGGYQNELYRNIDFGIFTKDFKLLLLIELNDNTHNSHKRKERDLKIKKILDDCNIKILYFYTKYPNEKEYIINRIQESINGIQNNNITN